MHHTDYSHNLRKTQHKTLKSLSTNRTNVNRDTGSHQELLRATIAVLLVVIALLQMDPANALASGPSLGYGNLVFNDTEQPTTANQIDQIGQRRHRYH